MKASGYLFPGLIIGPIVAAAVVDMANSSALIYDDSLEITTLFASGLLCAFVMYIIDKAILKS